MALTASQKSSRNFKKFLGLGETNTARDFFEEAYSGPIKIVTGQIWAESDSIPNTAPVLAADAVSGVVQYKEDLALTAVPGTTNSFYHADLLDAIPFNYGDGTSYNYTIKNSLAATIPFGDGEWVVDTEAGLLTFYGTVPANMPPTISFYRYVGAKGITSYEAVTANRTIYLDPAGDDISGDGSVGSPFFSLHRALKDIPKIFNTNRQITILLNDGDYDWTSLGPINVDFKGYLGRLVIDHVSEDPALSFESLAVPETGNFDNDPTVVWRKTDTGKAWGVNTYQGKFLKVNSVHSGTLPTGDYAYQPIHRNGSDWLETPSLVNGFAKSDFINSYEIVQHKARVDFGSNSIFMELGSLVCYINNIQITSSDLIIAAESHSVYNCSITSRTFQMKYKAPYGTSQILNYIHQTGVVGEKISGHFSACCILIDQTAGGNAQADNGVIEWKYSIIETSVGGANVPLIFPDQNTVVLQECFFINYQSVIQLSSPGADIEVASTFYFENCDIFINGFYHDNFEVKVTYNTYYTVSFDSEPSIGRLSFDGVTAADKYYDAETGLNALAIAPDAYRELYMSTLPVDIRNIAYESATRTIYIDPAGDDDTGTGLVGAPFATLQRALKDIKSNITAGEVIYIYANPGTYNISSSEAAEIRMHMERFKGNGNIFIYATPGSEWSTVESGTMTANDYFIHTDSSKAWGTNAHQGRFLRDGAAGEMFPIESNTATELYHGGSYTYATVSITNYDILEHAVIFQGTGGESLINTRSTASIPLQIMFKYIKFDNLTIRSNIAEFIRCQYCSFVNIPSVDLNFYSPYKVFSDANSFTGYTGSSCSFNIPSGSTAAAPVAMASSITGTLMGVDGTKLAKAALVPYNFYDKVTAPLYVHSCGFRNCLAGIGTFYDSNEFILSRYYEFFGTDFFLYSRFLENVKITEDISYPVYDLGTPTIGYLTFDGTNEADHYYNAEKELNALVIAPAADKEVYMSTLPVDIRDFAFESASSRDIYISPTGDDDTGDGSSGNPFFSLHRAFKDIKIGIDTLKTINILAEDGYYDFSALGNLNVTKVGFQGNINIKSADAHAGSVADAFKSLGTPVTGNFDNPQVHAFRHTDTGAAWTPDAYNGKFLKVNSVHSGTLPTGEAGYVPIHRNGADTIDTPLQFSGYSTEYNSYEIVDHEVHFDFGTNDIYMELDKNNLVISAVKWESDDIYIVAGYPYSTNTTFLCGTFWMEGTSEGSYPYLTYIYNDNSSSEKIFAQTIGHCAIKSNADYGIFPGNKVFSVFSSICESVRGTKTEIAVSLSDGGAVNFSRMWWINLDQPIRYSGGEITIYSNHRFEDCNWVIDNYYSNVGYVGYRYGTFAGYAPVFDTEPDIARLTFNGSAEADYYYNKETGLNYLAIAPDDHQLYVSKSANYSANLTNEVVNCTSSPTITLPTAATITGKQITVKNSGTGTVTVDTTGSETIDGYASVTVSTTDSLTFVADGTNWIII